MKGKFFATTLCITGLAIITLPTNHADASWATQYLKNNGYGSVTQPKIVEVSKPASNPAPTANMYYSYYYYRKYFNTKPVSQPAPVTTLAEPDIQDDKEVSDTNYHVSQDEAYMLQLINSEREKLGVDKLTMDENLAKLARLKSEDMAKNNYFNHESPTYGSPFEMMKDNEISYQMAAENIAKNSSVYKAHVSLMNSESHRANILNPGYNKVGIGIVKGQNNTYIITEMFIKN
ncbi:MAG: CAP domain-containing protein [Thermoanaerobacteraceae bacterium]|nr:CAP domain-containing protein [Thermoanaerobacteraceae bacterium]